MKYHYIINVGVWSAIRIIGSITFGAHYRIKCIVMILVVKIIQKYHSGCSVFSFTCNSDKQQTSLSDVMHICELTETISSTLFNMACKKVLLTMIHWTIMHGPQLMTNWTSRAFCAVCCQAKWSMKWQTITAKLRPHMISIYYFNGNNNLFATMTPFYRL
jgi:hypothetical protein